MIKVTVVGTTSWGTTLAIILARKGLDVCLWARTKETARQLDKARENRPILPKIKFPQTLSVTHDIGKAMEGSAAVVFAVPSQSMRQNLEVAAPHIPDSSLVLSAAKGLELGTNLRMSEVISQVLDMPSSSVCVLSGPNLASEVARGLPAAAVIASGQYRNCEKARHIIAGPHFRVQASDDVVGVELGGSLKNIIALGAGIADGLGRGDNAKAVLVTEGWAEITRLGVAMGADSATFSGLAGLGDLIATCASPLSRNHYYGEQLARGKTLAEIMESTPHVAEGIPTTRAAYELSAHLRVEMPIIKLMYQLLFEDLSPQQVIDELMVVAGMTSAGAPTYARLF